MKKEVGTGRRSRRCGPSEPAILKEIGGKRVGMKAWAKGVGFKCY